MYIPQVRGKWRKRVLALILLAASGGGIPGCSGATGPNPQGQPIIAVGIARRDLSPIQQLTGYLVFFYDPDQRLLLQGTVMINDLAITETFEPGIVSGPIYSRGSVVRQDESYQLVATIDGPDGPIPITSAQVISPSTFHIEMPAVLALGQPLTVTWDPVGNAEAFNATVFETGFEAELPGTATSFTFPAEAFTGLTSGQLAEIEITAYNGFYISLSSAITTLGDAEEAILRFSEAENITGAGVRGSFGTATTDGDTVRMQ